MACESIQALSAAGGPGGPPAAAAAKRFAKDSVKLRFKVPQRGGPLPEPKSVIFVKNFVKDYQQLS